MTSDAMTMDLEKNKWFHACQNSKIDIESYLKATDNTMGKIVLTTQAEHKKTGEGLHMGDCVRCSAQFNEKGG